MKTNGISKLLPTDLGSSLSSVSSCKMNYTNCSCRKWNVMSVNVPPNSSSVQKAGLWVSIRLHSVAITNKLETLVASPRTRLLLVSVMLVSRAPLHAVTQWASLPPLCTGHASHVALLATSGQVYLLFTTSAPVVIIYWLEWATWACPNCKGVWEM